MDGAQSVYPIINVADLTPERFASFMNRHRCLQVRGLFGQADVLAMRSVVAQTYVSYDSGMAQIAAGGEPASYDHVLEDGFKKDRDLLAGFRQFGSLVLGFCPTAVAVITDQLSRSPIRPCVEAYFRRPIGLSMNSSSVRLSETTSPVRRVFHQDGNFLGGRDAETINCWIALDPCGEDAPGLEVFPQRIDDLLPAGQPGAVTGWEIAEDLVYERFGADASWIPSFQPGDAFIFDHLHVHRTHLAERMTRNRYAVESWMFPITEAYRSQLLAWLG